MRKIISMDKLDLYLAQMIFYTTILLIIGDLVRLFAHQARGTEVRSLFMLSAVLLGYGSTRLCVSKQQKKRRGLVLLIISLLCIDLILCLYPEHLSILLHGLSHWFLGGAMAIMLKGNRIRLRYPFYLSGAVGGLYFIGIPLIYLIGLMIIAFIVSLSYKLCMLWNNQGMLN